MRPIRIVFPCLIAILLLSPASAQQRGATQQVGPRKKVRARKIAEPPMLDGRVTESVWESIPPATDFIQQEPSQGAPSTQRTEIRVGFDDDNLYIGIVCYDEDPDNITVTQNRRDASLSDTDSIQILLDTFHDRQNAFVFGTSPSGAEYDAQVSKAGQIDSGAFRPGQGGAQQAGASAVNLNWDAVWQVAAQITSRGWEAEMVIPFHTLRYQPGKDKAWGMQVMRNMRRRNEQAFWSPVSRAFDLTQVDVAGDLEGLDLRLHRDLRLLPYVLGGFQQDFTGAQKKETSAVRQAGMDVKYSLTPSLTLDGTINTDFAQVEVDEQQINLTRFDVFFPEKRPFFLENAGIFDFGTPRETELFFSRRIGIDDTGARIPIDAGVRVSGFSGKYEIGFLEMKTRAVDRIAPSNSFTVARLKRDMRNRTNLGVMLINRQSLTHVAGERAYNRGIGVDYNLGLGRYINWTNYLAYTFSPGLSGSTHALASSFRFDNRRDQIQLAYREVGRNFNPEVGYLQRGRYRRPTMGYRHTFYPESRFVRSVYPHFNLSRWYTLGSNDLESSLGHFDYGMSWQDGSQISFAYNNYFERLDRPFQIFPGIRIPVGRYSFGEAATSYSTNQAAPLFGSIGLTAGQFYNGTYSVGTLGAGVRKNQNLSWTGSWSRNMIRLKEGNFNTDLVGFRFNWSFTAKSYLQSFTQYNSRTNQVGANIRFALLSTSSNGLYVVYNTRVATQDFLDPHGRDRLTQSRALFVKFNYLFDF